jgi:hypothetical protein
MNVQERPVGSSMCTYHTLTHPGHSCMYVHVCMYVCMYMYVGVEDTDTGYDIHD